MVHIVWADRFMQGRDSGRAVTIVFKIFIGALYYYVFLIAMKGSTLAIILYCNIDIHLLINPVYGKNLKNLQLYIVYTTFFKAFFTLSWILMFFFGKKACKQ